MLALGVLTCLLEKCGGIPPLASVVALLGPYGFLWVLLGSYECLCVPMGGGVFASGLGCCFSGFLWFRMVSYLFLCGYSVSGLGGCSYGFLCVSIGFYGFIHIYIYTYIYIH